MTNQFDADARFLRSTGAGRNDYALRTHGNDLFDRHLVIAANLNLRAQFSNVLDQVVGERIVVIEDEDPPLIVAARANCGDRIVNVRPR